MARPVELGIDAHERDAEEPEPCFELTLVLGASRIDFELLLYYVYVEDKSRDCLQEDYDLNAVHHAPPLRDFFQIWRLSGKELIELDGLLLLLVLCLVQGVMALSLILATSVGIV